MGALKLRKDVSKPGLLRVVRGVFEVVVEEVCGRKFSTGDCLMSGLAVFLEQHASLLQFDVTRHRHSVVEMNLRRLYGLAQVPCDTTLRRRLDPISPVRYRRAFQQVLQRAQRGKALQRMSAWRGHYLVAVDGTGTFSSQRVHGPCCLRARHRNGSTTYSHQQLCAVMVHLDQRQVLPMAIEAVRNGDGSTKSDCERGAWARLVPVLASLDRRMKLIVIADGLFSQGPQIRLLQEHGLRFLLAARAGDHPHLQAQLDRSDAPWFADPSPEGQERDRQLRVVPEAGLNAANPDLKVQVLQSSEQRGSGEDARRAFTWVTDLPLNPHNASELARAARSRWKIENETFNTLKNAQYLEHNFGHGTQHLSDTFAALMLLAFLIDQLLEMACPVMQQIFAKCYTRTATWERLRSSFCAAAFRNWQERYGHALGIYTAYLAYDTS